MSTYWDVYCKTCNSHADVGLGGVKNGEEPMIELIRNAPQVVSLANIKKSFHDWRTEMELKVQGHPIDLDWFLTHGGHELVARDEYGGFSGQCGEYIRCGECNDKRRCGLAVNHEGKCVVSRSRS